MGSVTIPQVAVSSVISGAFTLQSTTCTSAVLGAGAQCTATVLFNPSLLPLNSGSTGSLSLTTTSGAIGTTTVPLNGSRSNPPFDAFVSGGAVSNGGYSYDGTVGTPISINTVYGAGSGYGCTPTCGSIGSGAAIANGWKFTWDNTYCPINTTQYVDCWDGADTYIRLSIYLNSGGGGGPIR
jgi:hypothetical protein